MKRTIFSLILVLAAITAFGQTDKQETTYRRSSLYSIMLPDDKLEGDARTIVQQAFLEEAFPDKYNNFNLAERVLDLAAVKAIQVSDADVTAAQSQGAHKVSKFKKFAKGLTKKEAADPTATSADSTLDDAQYIAKLQKYFTSANVAGRLVAKWLGGPDNVPAQATPIDTKLIEELGLNTLSEEEKTKAKSLTGGLQAMTLSAETDLMSRTFVMVSRYSYLSAQDIMALTTAAASQVGGKFGQIASLAGTVAGAALKGYFVKTSTYLFQLDINKDDINKIVEKYANDICGLYTDNDVKLKYVGKTWDYAPATLKLSFASDADNKMISRATVRATDGAIAKLQKEYDQFKTLATLHQDGENLFAYVGKKEGCKEGTKFDVLQRVLNDDGSEGFEVVGKVSIQKGQLWDNRNGAGETIEGAATDDDKDAGNADLKYSGLGTSSKMLEGSLLRQMK